MRNVIVNSTPIIALCKIGALGVLKQLYGEIFIPEAIFNEIAVKKDLVYNEVKANADWIKIKKIQCEDARYIFENNLHAGEVETMILALENLPALVIIDDYKAREKAKTLGLPLTGTLGVLVKAKKKKIIAEIAPLLSNLIEQGIYISENILNLALKASGENEK